MQIKKKKKFITSPAQVPLHMNVTDKQLTYYKFTKRFPLQTKNISTIERLHYVIRAHQEPYIPPGRLENHHKSSK